MRRNLPNPLHTGIPQWGLRVKATGDGILNQDLSALFQQLDLFFLDGYGLVYLGGFGFDITGNSFSFSIRRVRKAFIFYNCYRNTWLGSRLRQAVKISNFNCFPNP